MGRHPELAAMPHSEESERAVLAAVLLAPRVLADLSARLTVADFHLERHRRIYEAMLEIADAGGEVDLRTLQAKLEERSVFEKVGGMAYLAGMDLDLPDLGRVDAYARIVKERHVERRLVAACTSIRHDLLCGSLDARSALERVEALVPLGAETAEPTARCFADSLESTLELMEERADGAGGLSTGFPGFDRLVDGLMPGNLMILAGRPGMGKTTAGLNIAAHVAFRLGLHVRVASLEMSEAEITMKLMAAETGLSYSRLRNGRLSKEEWGRLYDMVRFTASSGLGIDDTSSRLGQILTSAKQARQEGRLDLLVIDYLSLVVAGGRWESRQVEVAHISRTLKAAAREMGIPILVLQQLNRANELRADKRPVLSDLRESGAIEQDADVVAFLHREEEYKPQDPDVAGLAELIVRKNRHGAPGTVELVFDGAASRFREMERERSLKAA